MIVVPEIPEGLAVRELISRGGLHEHVRQFWPFVEPRPFVDNWHIGAVCEFLQAIFDGQILKGVINVPPGTGKSLLNNVFLPSYVWGRDPGFKFLAASFDLGVLLRDAEKLVDLMRSDLYREVYPESALDRETVALSELKTTARGLQKSVALAGKGTGWHGDWGRIDDPVKPLQASSKTDVANKKSIAWHRGTFSNRRSDPAKFRQSLTMQRLSKTDLSQYLLDQGFEHLCLPMRYEPKAFWILNGSRSAKLDPRKEQGELLFPARYPEHIVKDLEQSLATPQNISAQMGQNPTPGVGGITEAKWFRTYITPPQALIYVQFWDLNFKGRLESHSMVCGNLYAFGPREIYLIAEKRALINYPTAREMYIEAQKELLWKDSAGIYVEAKANGPALCDDIEFYNQENQTCIPQPQELEPAPGDKSFRLGRRSGIVRDGRVYIPAKSENAQETDWVYNETDGWLQEIVGFPNGSKDDRVDNFSAMLNWISSDMSAALRWEHG